MAIKKALATLSQSLLYYMYPLLIANPAPAIGCRGHAAVLYSAPMETGHAGRSLRNLIFVPLALLLLVGGELWLLTACASPNAEANPAVFTLAAVASSTPLPAPSETARPTAVNVPSSTGTPSATPSSPPTATAIEATTPTATSTATPLPTDTAVPSATPPPPPTATPLPSPTPLPAVEFYPPPGREFATLEEFWNGVAEWVLEIPDTGLPGGESDTVYRGGTEFWSYLHASHASASVVDQCGDPVPFPGCTTLWKSTDGGQRFVLENPVCLFPCASCPCDNSRDHIAQQQYPRVFFAPDQAYLVYEFGAYVYLRTSPDGVSWSSPAHVMGTWVWWHKNALCEGAEVIGEHPHIYSELEYDCLVGGPPGLYVEGELLYVFVGLGRAPGHMGCLMGNRYSGAAGLYRCGSNPLFGAELGYGLVELQGPDANPYFEFRTISSADVVRVGDRYYVTYEGVRGPSNPTVVDDQFGLGLARSLGPAIDGPWEKYSGNPILMPLPGNVGVGHADLLTVGDTTYLYTATPSFTRGRFVLLRR